MRALCLALILIASVDLAGCAGSGSDRGGWSVFEGGISCRDCERLVFSTKDDAFDLDRAFEVRESARLFAWYESPVQAGHPISITWVARDIPTIETRTATSEGWDAHEHTCIASRPTTPDPTPSPAPTSPSPVPPTQRCVWDFTPSIPLDAPDNGISIIWELENHGPGTMPVQFSAKLGQPS